MPKPGREKRTLTTDELLAIDLLGHVGMTPASWDKRFNRDVLQPAKETKQLSDKAVAQMWRLFIRYRRQISHKQRDILILQAQFNAAPDFRKQQAAANEQARIDEMKRKYAEALYQS